MHVLVADTCPEVRWALRTFLREELRSVTLYEVDDAGALLAQAGAVRADIIFLEWELIAARAREVLAALRVHGIPIPVIVIGHDSRCRDCALAAGADAFISKASSPEQLRQALRAVVDYESPTS